LWIQDSASISDPGRLVKAYAQRFVALGGRVRIGKVVHLDMTAPTRVVLEGGDALCPAHLVLCPGPWGKKLLEDAGYRVPMAFERGYHTHFSGAAAGRNVTPLSRPVYDTGGGYVLSPMNQGLRLTTGVELTAQTAAPNHTQLTQAEAAARQALDLGTRSNEAPWMGARPTFPDSRPCIGPLPGARGVSVAFGHQHIGFATAPGTARLLGDMLTGMPLPIDAAPFRPARFIARA